VRIQNSFIPVEGVGERTERRLWESGITHWDRFEPSAVGPTRADRIASFIDEARDRLAAGDAEFFDRRFPDGERWRLYGNFRANTCFFDIETTGLDRQRDRVTTVSFHRDGDTRTLVRGDDLTPENVRAEFAAADLLATYNGAQFDVPFLETSLGIDVTTPHLDLIYPCRRAGLTGGLDAVEGELGIGRDRPDVSGRDAVRLWNRYERRNDGDALETLIEYNREDTVNLRAVADAVTGTLEPEPLSD